MNLFIPAPANSLLATYHWADGPNLRPLLGWNFDPEAGTGQPVVANKSAVAEELDMDGFYRVRIMRDHPDDPDLVGENFNVWEEDTERVFDAACARSREHLLKVLSVRTIRAELRTPADFAAAEGLVAEGLAVMEGAFLVATPKAVGR